MIQVGPECDLTDCSKKKYVKRDQTQTEEEKAKGPLSRTWRDVTRHQGMQAATGSWKRQGKDSPQPGQGRSSPLSAPWFQCI